MVRKVDVLSLASLGGLWGQLLVSFECRVKEESKGSDEEGWQP